MSLWIVVGGQYGSEGKGKISAFLTQREEIDLCIRCGGPNSGHSFVANDGTTRLLRQLPTGYIRPQTRLLVPAGALIDLDVLRQELNSFELWSRVGIDRNAMIIDETDRSHETELKLRERLSSTLCGVGSAVARRALRGADVRLAAQSAKEVPWLAELITDVSEEANSALDSGKGVLVEGTQGFGLSVYHSDNYPKATSRDTTAAAFLSEVGLSPRLATQIVVVFRTFPIRVAGEQAGPMRAEIKWETIREESGYPYPIDEMTTVTRKLRRVARFDYELAATAVKVNRPTMIALNGLDYLDFQSRGVTNCELLSRRPVEFLSDLSRILEVPIALCGTGPGLYEVAASKYKTCGELVTI